MKLTIITINLNNKNGLRQTIDSIKEQSFQDFQYIVIDGDSTDGSQEIIANDDRIDKWVSEKDSGVYDAMNKGIKISTGEYLLFLNSGDVLYEKQTLEKAIIHLDRDDIIYGNLLLNDKIKPYVYYFPKALTFKHLFHGFLGHPSTFIKRDLFEKYGLYETEFKIVADWAFMVRVIAKENVRTKYIEQVISIFDMDGMSANPANESVILGERKDFLQKNFPLFYEDYITIDKDRLALERLKSSKAYRLLKFLGVKKFR